MVLLGAGLIPLGLLRDNLDWRDCVLSGALMVMGGGFLIRSASKKLSREQQVESGMSETG